MQIWYLYNSGFAVKTAGQFFVFDYYRDHPRGAGLDKGVINPAQIANENTFVFVSHVHPDHYNRRIFSWQKEVSQIQYILADEIKAPDRHLSIAPGQTIEVGDVVVKAYESTDTGVAFLIEAGGQVIYHAGDLNWWRWQGETLQFNKQMEVNFKKQMQLIKADLPSFAKGRGVDLAFLTADPKQEEDALLGFDYFMREIGAKAAVPMHFEGDYSVFNRLQTDPCTKPYRDRICMISHRGEMFEML